MKKTNIWGNIQFEQLAGVNTYIFTQVKTRNETLQAQRNALIAQGKKTILDPFVGYIERIK